ncbi:A-kinase anchor protein 4-like [Anolis carolinensis]|uniref:A-kinase anchor protein 4-like n=1 Tax=Anolis carolinensis TaxID=28377 RepID=UPI000462796D|nr:PREDICTED: A-kinase anchor protein 4-like [Anolis carolinensis]|eukprot:XP_016849556.1 PREDICTED: A-kinase anchor protein 4-like [Anolis carolinensis]
MPHELDWLNSQAGMCKVNFYSPDGPKDQQCKVVCFVDVADMKDKFPGLNIPTDQPSNISDSTGELVDIEDKEVVIIKDNEQSDHVNAEGSVCLLKPGFSKDTSVVSWLSNDLQKYALGFQHALSPSEMPCNANVFDTVSQNNNNTAPSQSSSERPNPEDLAYYANKLCNLVLEMTRKEIKEKWESSGKCTRHTITSPYSAEAKSPASEGADVSKKPPQERSVKIEDAFTSENAQKMQDTTYSDKFRMDDGTSVSKGMMVYANQVASDMMLSFLKTMKVQKGRRPLPACTVLKEVLLRHAKEVVSDLIDSSMKNLHNITGALMTDSDFVYGLKRNLYNVGTQKTSEVMEAMVKRLFKLLSVDDRPKSYTFTAYKAGAQSNQRTQDFQFASLKRESHSQGKDHVCGLGKSIPTDSRRSEKASMDLYAKELIVAALKQIQQHLLEKTRENRHDGESNMSSFGYIHRDTNHDGADVPKYSSNPSEGRADISDSLRGHLILPMVQKILREAGLNLDSQCLDKNQR